MISSNDIRNGVTINLDGHLWTVIEFLHVKPGKGSAFVRTSIKSLLTGRVLQPTFKSGDKVGKPDIEERQMQFLYKQGDDYYFMDTRNYEQTFLGEKVLGDSRNFLKENIEASVLFYNGKPIGVSLPNSVDLKVVKCDPGIRGDTVSGATKPATLETGYVVNVPLFINEGDVLKIDTRDGKYLTRVAAA